ncbi:alcohol dehydrogenase catalytic domain-containing protein [Streptomyces sp. NPDC005248]|uniref:alcohol dehydrogenase catalytic domain-containing protein n=1 Tax=Streptomyces sp. NPDC005248 TaxID=3364709 RepID=UPI0036B90F70
MKDVPDAKIEHPCDIIVKITTTNICGSDLHMYEGRTSFESGRTLGRENMGQVEVGSAVPEVQVGQYVVLPFNIACGFCKQCERGLTNYCLTMQPEPALAGAAYGFADMGPYQGGQAELLRVPYGDFNALRPGEDAADRQTDYVMLADIFPTGYHATEMAHVKPGDQTIVFGAGPVGLMAAYSARSCIRTDTATATSGKGPEGRRPACSSGPVRGNRRQSPRLRPRLDGRRSPALPSDLNQRQSPALRPGKPDGGRPTVSAVAALRPGGCGRHPVPGPVPEASLPDGSRTSTRPTPLGGVFRLGSHP